MAERLKALLPGVRGMRCDECGEKLSADEASDYLLPAVGGGRELCHDCAGG